jgi:hypothetical protein
MQEFVVGGVADPAFDGDGVVCEKESVSNRKILVSSGDESNIPSWKI